MFKVLIVEDHASFRESLVRVLQSKFEDILISEAEDGSSVLSKVEADEPDLILMDVGLPGVNGITLTRKIKKNRSHIRVAVLTNYDSAEYKEAAYQAGADYFLSKSTTGPGDIAAVVEAVMGGGEESED